MSEDAHWDDSAALHTAVEDVFKKAVGDVVSWEFVEAVSAPTLAYVQARLDREEDGGIFFSPYEKGGFRDEAGVRVGIYDENAEELVRSKTLDLSAVIWENCDGDHEGLTDTLAAIERSIAKVRAKMNPAPSA